MGVIYLKYPFDANTLHLRGRLVNVILLAGSQEWGLINFILRRHIMATKDTKKDSKDKKPATKTLKEKRAAKKEKKGK